MHTLFLCGGSGQRLWPLSNPIRSKMFLKLLPAPNGGLESMIERLSRQLSQQGLNKSTIFVTHEDQKGLTQRYTKNHFPVIGEPSKRGTFTAAALGAVYLHSTGKAGLDETICVAPADMYADDSFFEHFHAFPKILKASQADIALLGTRPIYPSDQYGYILPGSATSKGYLPVIRFEEKPDYEGAQSLIQQHALWNCGVFAFPLQFMLSYLEQIGLPTEFNELITFYPHLPVRSFDTEVVERTKEVVVIRHEGAWCDLGSWESLTEQLCDPVIGEGGIWGGTSNTHIINELEIPLFVLGVSDIVAIASPDGILVANKNQANGIKEIIGSRTKCLMYGETHWGSYTVIDQTNSETKTVITIKLSILPDHRTDEFRSEHIRKVWTLLSGHGEVLLNDSIHPVRVGDVFTITEGIKHEIRAYTAMEWIEVRVTESHLDDNELIYAG